MATRVKDESGASHGFGSHAAAGPGRVSSRPTRRVREDFMRGLLACLVTCLALAASAQAGAQAETYPARPITIVVPFAAGSGTDSIARIVGQHLSTAFNQGVVIENKV